MTKNTFPPIDIPVIPLDEGRLAELVERAIVACLSALSLASVGSEQRQVTRPFQNGFETIDIAGPAYGAAIWRESEKLAQLPETRVLTEYLWAHGAFRKSFSRDDGGEVPRSAWDRAVWGELIHSPLLWLLSDSALEDLSLTGEFRAWHADPQLVREAAKEVARRNVRQSRRVHAQCLLGFQGLDPGETIALEPGVALRKLSTAEHCVHLTKYWPEYSSDDMSAPFFDVCLTIERDLPDLSDYTARLEVANVIDRAKWALTVAAQRDFAIDEGPAIVRAADGRRCRTLRRDMPLLHGRSPVQSITISAQEGAKAAELLREYTRAVELAPNLGKALWLFGRSCTAGLARDSLLDAVIGLDSLLVPGGGEGRYRVALHGAALLADGAAYEMLRKLYDLRSSAAHSAGSDDEKFREMAPLARVFLARIIHSLARLLNVGAIPLASGERIAQGVERWIRGRLIDSAAAVLSSATLQTARIDGGQPRAE